MTRLLLDQQSAPSVAPNGPGEPWSARSNVAVDLVVTLGGDGTILRASSLFRTGPVPPVLSFSMGTLGFLLPFRKYVDRCIYRLVTPPRYT